jgi:histidinol-phosphate phosphatase family protein
VRGGEAPADLVSVVVPTIGRPSLRALLDSVVESARHTGQPLPAVFLVDDRPAGGPELPLDGAGPAVRVLRSGGRGPAAARNVGWRAGTSRWVAFLDDDVTVTPDWLADLVRDLESAAPSVAGSQGNVTVPLPAGRAPTDWERGTAGLEQASWITADMAYRRAALERAGGFNERFPRAFREDADLALTVLALGHRLERGSRHTVHPVRPAGWWVSVAQQRGNADDVLMQRLHGPGWQLRARAAEGRRPVHLLVTALATGALLAVAAGRRRLAGGLAAGWLAGTAEFSARRILPGPRDPVEVAKMVSTSVLIPPAATGHWLAGRYRHRRVRPRLSERRSPARPSAVLLDRDGTIIRDVPYNGDPTLVQAMPGARRALDRLRSAGIPLAVISNQSGIGRGLLDPAQVAAVNARVEELLGPFDAWAICPHAVEDGCDCRKPRPGLIHRAADQLGVDPRSCVVIGDIGSDVESARAAQARAILVPTPRTRAEEVRAAPVRARTLADAVELVLSDERSREEQGNQ